MQGGNPPIANIFGLDHEVNIQTRAHFYDTSPSVSDPSGSKPNGSLTIEKPTIDIVPQPLKWVLRKSNHNPNVKEAQIYIMLEYLAQSPCAMSALEILQSFPTQIKALLSSIAIVDQNDTSSITFDLDQLTSRIPSHVSFHIKVLSHGMDIF